ncbi:DUF5713 family protein [Kitasatospora sp. NPDC056273]|uniref:DUF5713 family protein n=1 Tax=unclassified Kitasatospora TaxID=2633591 RepID=UPI0035D80826
MAITNEQVTEQEFLREMSEDPYFPDHLVAKGRAILVRLCERIEAERPADLPTLYVLSHAAAEEFNRLDTELKAAGSEIETAAREDIAEAFWIIASAYGFEDADVEEMVEPREW